MINVASWEHWCEGPRQLLVCVLSGGVVWVHSVMLMVYFVTHVGAAA